MNILLITLLVAAVAIIIDAILLINYEDKTKESLKPIAIDKIRRFRK
jgi:hypothetical protein